MNFWIRLGFSVTVVSVLIWVLPWSDMAGALSSLHWYTWLSIVGIFLLGHGAGAMKWRGMVNAGRAHLGRLDALRCYGVGLFANLCLPSIVGGDVLRGTLAARMTRPAEAIVWGSIADRLIDVLALSALILGGLVGNRGRLPGNSGTAVVVLALGGVLVGGGVLWRVATVPLARWPRKLRRPAGRSLVALRRMRRHPAATGTAFAIALAMQSTFVLLNAWIGRSVGIEIPVAVWFLAWPLAKLTALIPISLNGLGLRDATQGALLATVGVPVAVGVVASLVWQSVLVAGGVLAGGIYWMLGRLVPVPETGKA